MADNIEYIKEKGNHAFKCKDYSSAITLFAEAIQEIYKIRNSSDPSSHSSLLSTCLTNRTESFHDAKEAVQVNTTNQKAHCRLVKSLIELQRFKEARLSLSYAIQTFKENSDLLKLENEIFDRSGVALRPKPTDFEVLDELGDGNFSKVVNACYRKTGKIYAIKTIERMTVDRMKKRHPNINNEILMEKRVLNKLDHPNIVTLFSTFQDYGTLYYQMEWIEGNDLWSLLQEGDSQVGCHWSQALCYFKECVDAVEYMHRKGVVHRDIKPENIIISIQGHVKFVDFGTAKDLFETNLNGPNFVGTPEYMSPTTVRNKETGVEADLWSLGVLLYQMFLGYSPFQAASPYLTFLRIKRAKLILPDHLSDPVMEVIKVLLTSDDRTRLNLCLDRDLDNEEPLNHATLRYDFLQSHRVMNNSPDDECGKIPSLKDLCIRAVGQAALVLSDAISNNGGIRPQNVSWMHRFRLFDVLSEQDRNRIAHYLQRRDKLHLPGVFRLFHSSLVDAKLGRASHNQREFVGLTRKLHGHWDSDFYFTHISNPCETSDVVELVSVVNKLRPKFVVITGNFTSRISDFSLEYEQEVEAFRKTMARLSDTIPSVYVPGDRDVGVVPTKESLCCYRKRFGADFFGFWFGGLRCVVINSSLMIHPQLAPTDSEEQDQWLEEEIEQSKLCSTHMMLFSYHPWFHSHLEEEDRLEDDQISCFPRSVRMKWLQTLRHHKVRLVVSVNQYKQTEEGNIGDKSTRPFFKGKKSVKEVVVSDEPFDENRIPDKPSEIIKEALTSGELSPEDVNIDINNHDNANSSDTGSYFKEEGLEDSDEDDFKNEEEDCDGPEMLQIKNINITTEDDVVSKENRKAKTNILIGWVKEYDIIHKLFVLDDIPKTTSSLVSTFKD